MPLTIRKALAELDVLSKAKVVAGQEGLDRVIRWVHVVDIPDIAPWVRGGDLLLTTAFAIKDNPEAQLELIPSLVEKGLTGMLVAVGRYFDYIPPEMISLADELNFPIITLSWGSVPFVEITEAIHRYIISEQYELVQQSFQIHKILTQLVLDGQGLEALADSLASILNLSVTIENASSQLLAYTIQGPTDLMRDRSVVEGQTPEELVSYLADQGLFEQLRIDPRPRRVPTAPQLGMTLERIIAPIMIGSHLYGFVWIIATDNPLTELDYLAIERASTVAALIMSREQAVYEAEQRLKNQLMDNLLDPDPYYVIRDLTDTLYKLGLQHGYQILAVGGISDPTSIIRLSSLIETKLRSCGLQVTVVERGQRLIVILGNSNPKQGIDAAHDILQEARRQGCSLVIGLSSASHQTTQLRQCYQEAIEALQVGMTLSPEQSRVWAFEDLGVLHWLHSLPSEVRSANRYQRVVEEIIEYDLQHKTEFFKTLEVYLDHLGNAQQAAVELFIHRNTLKQRLDKIEQIWNLDLRDPNILLNLLFSLKSWRLNRNT